MKRRLLKIVDSVINELWLYGILGDWAEDYMWSKHVKANKFQFEDKD